MAIALLLAWFTLPSSEPRVQQYDVLVHNVVMGPQKPWLEQLGGVNLIGGYYRWEWWRLTKDLPGLPYYDRGLYRLRWYDKRTKRWQRVQSVCLWEITSVWDLEIADREFHPESERRGLVGERVREAVR